MSSSEQQKESGDQGTGQGQAEQSSIYQEYMKLLAGGRVSSGRRSTQTQSVMERQRQEQLEQMKQQQTRRRKEPSKKPRRKQSSKEGREGGERYAGSESGEANISVVSSRKRGLSSKGQVDQGSDSDQTSVNQASGQSEIKKRRSQKSQRKKLQGGVVAPDLHQQSSQRRKFKEIGAGEKAGKDHSSAAMHHRRGSLLTKSYSQSVGKHPSALAHRRGSHKSGQAHGDLATGKSGAGQQQSRIQRAESQALTGSDHRKLIEQQRQQRGNEEDGDQIEIMLSSADENELMLGKDEDGRSSMVSRSSQAAAGNLIDELGSSHRDESYSSSDEDRADSQNDIMDAPGRNYTRPKVRRLLKESTRLKQESRAELQSRHSSHQTNAIQLNMSQVTVPADDSAGSDEKGSRSDDHEGDSSDMVRDFEKAGKESAASNHQRRSDAGKVALHGAGKPSDRRMALQNNPEQVAKSGRGDAIQINTTESMPGRASAMKDQVKRQLEELKSLDKVFPDPTRTDGCFVQILNAENPSAQDYGRIISCANEKDKQQNATLADLTLNVKGLNSEAVNTHSAGQLKFLARAYLCNIADIQTEKLPLSLLAELNLDSNKQIPASQESETAEGSQIILIQTISTKVVQQVALTVEQQESAEAQSYLSEGCSSHRLHALIVKQSSSSQEHQFTLHPVVFRPSQSRGKKSSTRVQLPFTAPSSEADQGKEIAQLCYKQVQVSEKSLQVAREVQKAFVDSYYDRISKVRVTIENVQQLLFSIVQYTLPNPTQNEDTPMAADQDQPSSQLEPNVGIATGYKVVKPAGDILIFVSLFLSQEVGMTTAWVSLAQCKVYADVTLGFVSQKWLEKFQVHDYEAAGAGKPSIQKMGKGMGQARQSMPPMNKLRQLQMLNWQESQHEKINTLNFEDLARADSKAQSADGKEESSSAEQQYGGKQIRQAIATNDMRASNCKKCNFITNLESHPSVIDKRLASSIKVLMCSRCSGKYHEQCLEPYQRNISQTELSWRCPDCIRCSNCKSQQCSEQLMTCQKCNTPTHYDCLSPEYRQSLRSLNLYVDDIDGQGNEVKKLGLQIQRFRCQDCIKCQNCDATTAGPKKHHKWSRDFKLCAKCNKMRDKRLFCPVCERFQPEGASLEREVSGEIVGIQMIDGEKMIKCRQCSMLVHVDCDRMLSDANIRSQIIPDCIEGELITPSANQPPYKCPNCRKANRNQLLEQIVDVMISQDKQQHFLLPFWEQMTPTVQQAYFDIIKRKPICFKMISDNVRNTKKYLVSPADFWKDIERVLINAKVFNDSVDVYNAAVALHEKANAFLKNRKLVEQVLTNGQATMDETRFTLFMRKIAKDLRKGIVPSGAGGTLEQRRPQEFKVTAKQMLQGSEVLDLRIFGIQNNLLEVINQNSTSQDSSNLLFLQSNLTPGHLQQTVAKKSKLPAHKQWEKLMEDLQTNDERDTCWYPNPIKICFTDPALVFEEMCYLCGAFGNKEDFLCCNLCGESFHPYCLPYPKSNSEQFQDYWRCYNCMFCEKCHSSKQWEGLLICAICDKVDHFWCLEPQLIQVPECNWKCPECFKCYKCGTKSFFNEKDIENKVNLDPNEKFVLSCDFELCYQCGLDEYRKSFCSICNEKTGFGHNSAVQQQQSNGGSSGQQKAPVLADLTEISPDAGILRCNQCGFYSHLHCSKTDMAALKRHAVTINRMIEEDTGTLGTETAKSIYRCIDCLLIDRLPSFYIYHQCELYESLHQSMQRWGLLLNLLETMLVPSLLERAVQDPMLYVRTFAEQNAQFFREDRLVQQWLALLDSSTEAWYAPSTQSDTQSNSAVPAIAAAPNTDAPQPANEEVEQTKNAKIQDQANPANKQKPQQDTEQLAEDKAAVQDQQEAHQEAEKAKAADDATKVVQQEAETNEQEMREAELQTRLQGIELGPDLLDYGNQQESSDPKTAIQLRKKQRVSQDLYGHKSGFIPLRRDLYESLLRKENTRAHQSEMFEDLDELRDKITVPTDQVLNSIDINELFVKIELRAVLKIRLLFAQWAQNLVHNSVAQFNDAFVAGTATNAQTQETNSDIAMKDHDNEEGVEVDEGRVSRQVDQNQNAASEIEFCQDEDVLIDNPQKRLTCLLCGLNGERSITGRLIPFQIDQFVHVNCAMWTQEVQEGQEEGDSTRELYNLYFAYNEFKSYTCDFCHKPGATIFCSNRGQKKCPAAFHFPCAYSSGKVAFLPNTDIYCEACIPKTPEATPGFPIEFKNYPKRRIIIVNNIEPQCTLAFQNQLKKQQQAANQQTSKTGAGKSSVISTSGGGAVPLENENSVDSPTNLGNSGMAQQAANGAAGNEMSQMGGNNQGDVGVIIQCNKWRPYYYDMFNRVGNLTLLSLSRRRNSIIESLHTFTHENRSWFERFNLRFPEEDQTDYAALRIYWNYKQPDQLDANRESGFARDDVEMADHVSVAAVASEKVTKQKGPPDGKSYFLFNGSKVEEVDRHDYSKIRRHINRRLHEYQGKRLKEMNMAKTDNKRAVVAQPLTKKQSVEQFWLEQIGNLALRYPLFCQENTYQTSKVISGVEKFPVQYWNNPGEKLTSGGANGSEKQGLELKDLGVAGFFYKSGFKSLESQKIVTANKSLTMGHAGGSGGANSSNRYGSGNHGAQNEANQVGERQSLGSRRGQQHDQQQPGSSKGGQASVQHSTGSVIGQQPANPASVKGDDPSIWSSTGPNAGPGQASGGAPPQTSLASRNTSLESIFKQILEANQVNDQKTAPLIVSLATDDKNEDSSADSDSRRELSTKVMNYEQVMACLGKKTLKMRQDERRKQEEEKARQEQLKQQQMQLNAIYAEGQFGGAMFPRGMLAVSQGQTQVDATGKNSSDTGQGTTKDGGDAEETKDGNASQSIARKGKMSELNDMTNKGNDINAAMKYRAAKQSPKLVEVWISKIHRNGLFACQPLNPKDIVIEYVGEKIRDPVADKREVAYNKLGVGDCYNFRLNSDYIIDATFYGSKARYINHSCEPNLISEYLTVNGETHIIFVAARKIAQGEELTFDYNFMPEMDCIECFCGSENCKGRID